jgi:2-polyprenyl-6-methoxyphenol hydroxylase-like FAD-dependent oxidoreductase
MMLGFLLARAGISVLVLEKHADFLRDFRGDTIHPSTLEIMYELGLLDEFLRRPHQEVRTLGGQIGDEFVEIADFTHLPTHCRFIALMPQWDFLDFLAEHAKRFPAFHLKMEAEARDLTVDSGVVTGLLATTPGGPVRVKADLSSPPTDATPRCANGLVSMCSISVRRWTCCGCGCHAVRMIPGRPSGGSTPAASL